MQRRHNKQEPRHQTRAKQNDRGSSLDGTESRTNRRGASTGHPTQRHSSLQPKGLPGRAERSDYNKASANWSRERPRSSVREQESHFSKVDQDKEREEQENEDKIWEDLHRTSGEARRSLLQQQWATTDNANDIGVSDFCTSVVMPWLQEEENASIVDADKQHEAAAGSAKKIFVDFGCGSRLEDTRTFATLLNCNDWRLVAIEPYAPILPALKRISVPPCVEIVRRDFLDGAGLCQQWWKTPIDILYARHVFCALNSAEERRLLWQFLSTKIRSGGLVALQVCRETPPFDNDVEFNAWLTELDNRGFEAQKVCEQLGYALAKKR